MTTSTVNAKSKVLTFWTSDENVKDAISKIVPSFEKEYGIKVHIDILNKDLTNQFKTAAITGKGPDILVWAHDVVGELASSGLIEPINIPNDLKKKLLPVSIQAFNYNGKLYGYPYDLEAIALIYNKKLIKKIPDTMEELISWAHKFTDSKKGKFGFLYDIGNFFFSFPFFSAGGGHIFKNENGRVNVNNIGIANAGAINGISFIRELVVKGIIPSSTDYSIAMNKMKSGKLAVTMNGPWSIMEIKKSGIDYGISPIPSLRGKKPKPFVGSHGFIIRRSSKNKSIAKEFIENYLMSKEGILALYHANPRCPSRIDALKDLEKKDPDLGKFMLSASNGTPMPNVPEMSAVWSVMDNALKLSNSGQVKPETALKQAHYQILSALKIE